MSIFLINLCNTTSIINVSETDNKYVYYHLKSKQEILRESQIGAGIPALKVDIIKQLSIPIPPLPVQEEIVRILDRFTELEAELEARTKQYEYYRDELLTFGDEVEWKELGEVANIGDGLHGTPEYSEISDIYFINGNNIKERNVSFNQNTKKVSNYTYEKHKKKFYQNSTVFISLNGTIGDISLYNNEKLVLGKSVGYINIQDESICLMFLFYYLKTYKFQSFIKNNSTGSTIKNLGLNTLRKIKIPVPSLEEQERIVEILDRFDTLTSDITTGLPAEIAARRKQYEYYRDKLLTFKEKKED